MNEPQASTRSAKDTRVLQHECHQTQSAVIEAETALQAAISSPEPEGFNSSQSTTQQIRESYRDDCH